ncbi:MAG: TolC family protein [Bacteroidaceae bacterium]|nr:TolC family protein [Bacteroidaceae bacterium]MBQ8807614.1 TolC family protein [Bacteroidaceae bacterium]
MKRTILIACVMATGYGIQAQEAWSLQKCIEYAIEHNLSIKQQEASRNQSEVELNTAQWSRLPNLNGNVGQSFNFGRALQADNTYGNRNTANTNFSLGTNIPLFTGLQIPNSIALAKLNLKAATEDLKKAKEDISIQVASYYLQALFNEELSKVAQNQVKLSQEQLDRKVAFFKNGKASEAEVYEAKSRLAQDEMSAVQADNNYRLALLDLSQLLELSTPEGFTIAEPPTVEMNVQLSLPDEVYSQAMTNKPSIKAAQYRLEGAEKSIRIAQSGYYPQLSFGAGLSTNYYNMSGIETASFSSQWHQNFNKYLQFSLSIPLFNRFATRNRVKSARIQKNALQWRLEESKKTLYKEIQQAYYNALAAEAKYRSSQSASEASEASFKLMSEKYANGKATATEYNEVRTLWMKALSDHIQARYDYLFRSKILDFYKGEPLKL